MKRHRRNRTSTCPFKPGDRIQPTAMFEHHDYRRGESYEVVNIDTNDSTLRARDNQGTLGSWIRWRDCEPYNDIGWEWLKGQLSPDALEILSAFEGLHTLKLRPDLRVALMNRVPMLKERVLEASISLESSSLQS